MLLVKEQRVNVLAKNSDETQGIYLSLKENTQLFRPVRAVETKA